MAMEIVMLKIKVSGMTCGHCVANVTKAVQSVQTGIAVSVDLKRGEVTVPKNVDAAAVRRAIVAAGYDAPLSPASSDAATAEPADAVKTSCCCG
jgi:copper chaperone